MTIRIHYVTAVTLRRACLTFSPGEISRVPTWIDWSLANPSYERIVRIERIDP